MKIETDLMKLINSKKPILKKKLVELIEERIGEAYSTGLIEGYDDGYSAGRADGYDEHDPD